MPRAPVAGAAVLIALLVTAGILPSPAGADAISDKRGQAAALQRQIDGLNARIEALDEQYNQAQLRVEAAGAAVSQAQSALASSDQHLTKARSGLSDQAVASYIAGPPSAAIGPPATGLADFSVRKAYMRELASQSLSAIENLKVAKQDADDARNRVVTAQASAKGAVGNVASARVQVEQAVRAQQTALSRVNGDLGQLIAEEQARQEAEAKAKAAAELAARQAEEAHRLAVAAATRKAEAVATAPTIAVKPPAAPLPAATLAPATTAKPTPTPTLKSPTGSSGPVAPVGPAGPAASGASAAIAEARRQLGKPYQWAGGGPGSFDCSGLTAWAWRAGGVSLGHSTYAQWDETRHVSLGDIQPGDLIFYGSDLHHVTMYTGGGMMIEAPFTGADVREVAVRYDGIAGIGRVGA